MAKQVMFDRLVAAGFGSGSRSMVKVVSVYTGSWIEARYSKGVTHTHCYGQTTGCAEIQNEETASISIFSSRIDNSDKLFCRFQANCGCGQIQ